MTRPLDDVTIIEIDNWMAAPSAAAILCDLGARVIKVEPLSGDPMRRTGRSIKLDNDLAKHDYMFDVDNRGKESVCVDITQKEGQDVVAELCSKAHVFLNNLLPDRQAKYGLDPEALFKANPTLVHATLTGYGTTGPDAWRPGYDNTAFFARSGLYDAMREGPEGTPPWARAAQGDHVAGLALVGAVLGGLRMAERSGQGQVVETSLFETAVWTQATEYAPTVVDGMPLRKRARDELLTPTQNRYPCKDGRWIVFNMPEPKWWKPFCEVLGKPEWVEKYPDPRTRYRSMAEIIPAIDEITVHKSLDEWGALSDKYQLRWAPVLALHEVAEDPQAEAIGMFPEIELEGVGKYRSVRSPFRFHNADVGPKQRAPKLGAQSLEVLKELGKSDEDIERLKAANIIQ